MPTHPNKCTFMQQYFSKKKNCWILNNNGTFDYWYGKKIFSFYKASSPSHLLIDYQEVQRPGHEPEVRNEWSGASTPLIRLHVGPSGSTFCKNGTVRFSKSTVGQYKWWVTWIYIKGEYWGVFNCFMKYFPQLQTLSPSSLDGGDWPASRPGHITSGERPSTYGVGWLLSPPVL